MSFLRHLRFSLRRLRQAPLYPLLVVTTLTVGLAPVLVVGGVLDALAVRALPFPEPEQLFRVRQQSLADNRVGNLSLPTFRDLTRDIRRGRGPVAELATWGQINVTLAHGDGLERVGAALVSDNFFEVLAVEPARGRFFVPGEDLPGAPRTAVLSHRLWRHHFGGALNVVGRQIQLDAQLHRVIGILPPGFELPFDTDLWIPFNERFHGSGRFNAYLNGIARLADGVRFEISAAKLAAIAAALQDLYPGEEFRLQLMPFKQSLTRPVWLPLQVLLVIVFLLLLAACANVANLAMTRAVDREREMAIRTACGAEPSQLWLQVMLETTWLTAAAGVLGFVFAALAWQLLDVAMPFDLPAYLQTRIDDRVLAFGALMLIVVHGIFSALPAEQARRSGIGPLLQTGGRASATTLEGTWRRRFVQLQAMLALVLVTVTALLIRDASKLRGIDPGFAAGDVLTARLAVPPARYPQGRQAALFYRELRERLRALPGVDGVAMASRLPIGADDTSETRVLLEGRGDWSKSESTSYSVITPGYFKTLGVPLLGGRELGAGDRGGTEPAVVVNSSWVRRFAGDTDVAAVIGRRIEIGISRQWGRIVGVVADIRHQELDEIPQPYIYLSEDQFPWWDLCLLVESGKLPPEDLEAAVRREVATVDPSVPVFDVAALNQRIEDSLFFSRFLLGLVSGLGAVVLGLAMLGLFGQVAVAVEQQRHTIAVHLALGAVPARIRRELIGRTLRDVLTALAIGLAAVLALLPLIRHLLNASEPFAPAILGTVFASLLSGAAAAAWLASRRVTEIEPAEVLRLE